MAFHLLSKGQYLLLQLLDTLLYRKYYISDEIKMASVDGSRSLQGASDVLHEFLCGPCKTDNIERKARHYCDECSEYLCNQCEDVHRKLQLTKNHGIVSGNQLPATGSARRTRGVVVYCGCNKSQEVAFYCEEHKDVVCDACRTIKHHKCSTTSIQDKSIDYTISKLEAVLSKTKSLKDEFDKLKKESESKHKELKNLKESCRNEIKAFRNEINVFFDKLENDMLLQLDSYGNETEKRIDHQISTLTTAFQMTEGDYKLLENVKKDGRKSTMFASDVQMSRALKENRLVDINRELVKQVLSFEKNQKLADMIIEIKALGELKVSGNVSGSQSDEVLLGRKIQSVRDVHVKETDDSETPWISGCAVMPSGHIVLCDRSNHKIKLLDSSYTLRESFKLSSSPGDVSIVDDNDIIITIPDTKQLQYVQVFPQLKAGRVLQLDKKCWGVAVAGDKIFTTGGRKVLILDHHGNLQGRLGMNQDGSFMFIYPYYRIAISSSGEKLFVSDYGTNTITCMSVDGHAIYTYKDNELSRPEGLHCDGEDNVFVCGTNSHNVQVITADGKKFGTLLSSSDGLKIPRAISYSKIEDAVIVGCYGSDKLIICKLAI